MAKLEFVYVTYIATTPQKLWAALTRGEFTIGCCTGRHHFHVTKMVDPKRPPGWFEERLKPSTCQRVVYFKPSLFPAASRAIDSPMRCSRVSGRLAEWIQSTKSRR